MRYSVRRFGLVTAVVVAAASAALAASAAQAAGLPKGTKAPDFTLKDTKGGSFKLSSFKGKVVFLNFWATWCPPCRTEFPEVVKLNNDLAGKGVKVVSISVDQANTRGRIKPFIDDNKATQQVLLGDEAGDIFDRYANNPRPGIPMNVLIGKDGKVIKSWVGFRGQDDVSEWRSSINDALKAKTP